MSAEILSTGFELLIGKVVNTNSVWLAADITRRGYKVSRITCIGDELAAIAGEVQSALTRRPRLILVTGGLGPTFEDMTAEAVALALHRTTAIDSSALEAVRRRYDVLALPLTGDRLKMARLPRGSSMLVNPEGTAPGFALSEGHTTIICMPGVPAEMKAVWELCAEKYAPVLGRFVERFLHVRGLAESAAAPIIKRSMQGHPYVYIKSHPQGAESDSLLEIHVYASGSDPRLESLCDSVAQELKQEFLKAHVEVW